MLNWHLNRRSNFYQPHSLHVYGIKGPLLCTYLKLANKDVKLKIE